jgi:tRNA A-37 threonylcarbamoyl transferase component Bud32
MSEQMPQTLGRYTVRAELGRGGFATVYRAFDTSLEREVALKVLHPQLLTDRTFAQRFRKEARALAGMRHPNIITVFEVGEADGRLYISMELAQGPSLAQAIADRGRFPWNETLAILKPVCDALDYAHAQGIVHRDLKPANILLDKERGALLTDFGFARIMGESSVSMSLSGGILGTPAYIAPEVWELEAAKPAADIYALGCIIYEMLTGQVLFAGKTPMQTMRAHDQGPQLSPTPAWSADVPASLEVILQRALARRPGDRYPSAGAVWQALNDLETEAQAKQQTDGRAAAAAQWRTETEAALASGEWSVARMAVGRWLAISPDDPAAQAARAEIERRQAATQADRAAKERAQREAGERARQEAQRKAQEEAARKAQEEQIRQAREAARLAEQRLRQEQEQSRARAVAQPQREPSSRAAQEAAAPLPPTIVRPVPGSKRRIPVWVWLGGGAVLLACVVCGLVGFALFKPSSPATPAPFETVEPTAIVMIEATATPSPAVTAMPIIATPAPSPAVTEMALIATPAPLRATAMPLTATPAPTLVPTLAQPKTLSVRINRITINTQKQYVVEYETVGYTEKLPGMHIHFFFNRVPPEQAGVPGSGPWILYGGPRPFTGYKVSDRPSAATKMCALVANPDHSIQLNSGNCVDLP